MAGVTYKCPSCGAYLVFDPKKQNWKCDFCSADFTEKELLPKSDAYAQKAEQEHAHDAQAQDAKDTAAGAATHSVEGDQVIYHCPSCGSEIMTDATTVATHCYYCHNPVVLQGKLTADMKPDQVLPFSISKDVAVERFLTWVRKKKFVPKDFFAKREVETMSGVYYPHFVSECELDGAYEGQGQKVSTADTGKHIVTKTDHYAFRRRADFHFTNVMRPALTSVDRKLSDGIHPFPLQDVKPFSSAYLSGFLAERRDVDASNIAKDVQNELIGYVKPLLSETLPYSTYNGNISTKISNQKSSYVLLPTWVLTYRQHKKSDGQPYYYVMNGRTGTVCGKLPINKRKLYGSALMLAGLIFAGLCVASYFLF